MDDFAGFFAARCDQVFRAVLVTAGSRVNAEDAVAEAFARAYQRWPSVRGHTNPTAWVIRVALNVSRSWWRRRRREFLTAQAPDAPVTPVGHDGLDVRLAAELARLPRRQREVVALRILADLTAEETAGVLGVATATIHVHLHRALGALRQALASPDLTAVYGLPATPGLPPVPCPPAANGPRMVSGPRAASGLPASDRTETEL